MKVTCNPGCLIYLIIAILLYILVITAIGVTKWILSDNYDRAGITTDTKATECVKDTTGRLWTQDNE